jgi:hypothetical protein
MKEKRINIEIANFLDKKINTVDTWTSRNPKLLELCRLGMLCKKNGLNEESIKKLMEVKELLGREK